MFVLKLSLVIVGMFLFGAAYAMPGYQWLLAASGGFIIGAGAFMPNKVE